MNSSQVRAAEAEKELSMLREVLASHDAKAEREGARLESKLQEVPTPCATACAASQTSL